MNSWLNSLSLAQKARKVAHGKNVLESIRAKQAHLVLVASDASANTKKQMFDKSSYYNVTCLEVVDSITLSHAVGKVGRMYLAITDENFAKMILNKLKEE
ncbi:ribosomal protein L7Ae-like RNA K-turn-binding protein [Bacilli bacterium PM5-3]|nr:ribosomal protein L7Ae-like RNA K-turn-binding protein [Bacilli bacterium PM5-3]